MPPTESTAALTALGLSVASGHGPQSAVGSTDRCDTLCKPLRGRLIKQGLSWTFVELPCDSTELGLAVYGQVGAAWEILAQQPIGVFIWDAPPTGRRPDLVWTRPKEVLPIVWISIHQLDLARPPALVEERLERAIDAQDREPTLAGRRLNPGALLGLGGLGRAEADRCRAILVRDGSR